MATELEKGREDSNDETLDASGKRFALVVSRYSPAVTESLLASARRCLTEKGAREGEGHAV